MKAGPSKKARLSGGATTVALLTPGAESREGGGVGGKLATASVVVRRPGSEMCRRMIFVLLWSWSTIV